MEPVPIMSLWLPILVSAVLVFVASSIFHMVLPWHKNDFKPVPDEDKVMAALRPFNIPPGEYSMPRPADMAAMKSPEFQEKLKNGPVAMLTVLPNRAFNMGPALAKWFIYCVVVAIFAAYVAGRAVGAGAEYLPVFRFAGVTAFVGYNLAMWQATIWAGRSASTMLKHTVDGLVYGLLTGGAFGWLWPD